MNDISNLILPVMMMSAGNNIGAWPSRPIRRYEWKRYENAANKKQCGKRRAKNKAARKSRQRNRA